MKTYNSLKILPKTFLRVPLCSLSKTDEFFKTKDEDKAIRFLTQFFKVKINNDALKIASSALHDAFSEFVIAKKEISQKQKQRLFYSLYKYFVRMCSRPTPFGLFAGCNVSDINQDDTVNTARLNAQAIMPFFRYDSVFLYTLVEELLKNEAILMSGKFFLNTSIWEKDDKVRYIENANNATGTLYELSTVELDDGLQEVLQLVREGKSRMEIIEKLKSFGISKKEINEYLMELTRSNILVHELIASLMSPDPMPALLAFLNSFKEKSTIHLWGKKVTIGKLQKELQSLYILKDITGDNQLHKNFSKFLKGFQQSLLNVDDAVSISKKLRVDYLPDFSSTRVMNIDEDAKEILSMIAAFHFNHDNAYLEGFKNLFSERHDLAPVPLLNILDNEIGINYLTNTGMNAAASKKSSAEHPLSRLIFDRYFSFAGSGSTSLNLTRADLEYVIANQSRPHRLQTLLTTCYNLVVLREQEQNQYRVRWYAAPCHGFLNRFQYMSAEISKLIQEIVGYDQTLIDGEAFEFVDILHKPTRHRSGNVTQFERLFKYSINVLYDDSDESNILLSDIEVCVKEGIVLLRSKRINKFLIPVLSSAYNVDTDQHPYFRFLVHVGKQFIINPMNIFWPEKLNNRNYLPRIACEKVILSEATWQFYEKEIKQLQTGMSMHAFTEWKNKWKLNDKVVLVEGDNELYFDFTNEFSVRVFLDTIQPMKYLKIFEFLETNDNVVIRDEKNDGFASQCFYFFVPEKKEYTPDFKQFLQPETHCDHEKRFFYPGSEWIYLKLYCNQISANKIIHQYIQPAVQELYQKSLPAFAWFFIRYSDPHYHIRLRVKTADFVEVFPVLSKYLNKASESQLIYNMQLDTYRRELERYGGKTIEPVELIFHYDSLAVMNVINLYQGKVIPGDQTSYLIGIRLIDSMFDALGFNKNDKIEIIRSLDHSFGTEFNKSTNKALKSQLASMYRIMSKQIVEVLTDQSNYAPFNDWSASIKAITEVREQAIKRIVAEYTGVTKDNWKEVAASLVHMTMNRLFFKDNRFHEMAVYDLMNCAYKSIAARKMNTHETTGAH
ncbi:lantibiotic dehydratase [Gynurincola endophyticus]|uniref:lantibiotic dehydratase n=1 Tax=Gynurincola endophyticus TaxID=2479004 RepID=UPI000F8ED5BA|nr:lantibiotic dehydratase [Gynurincola endophyticus]